MRMWVSTARLLLPLAALAQQKPAQQDGNEAEPGEMRTMRLPNGSTIRYEVLPGDDDLPPGELIVMHFDNAPAPDNQAAPIARAEEPAPAAAQPRKDRRDDCRELRGRLAVRLLELRGLTGVDPQLAVWVDRNRYLAGGDAAAIQIAPDPLLLTALSSDAAARGMATELAACESTQVP
jgi:hypothetical protein